MAGSFESWMRRVDAIVWKRLGCSVHDLPDAPFADWHADGVNPSAAAARAIRMAREG